MKKTDAPEGMEIAIKLHKSVLDKFVKENLRSKKPWRAWWEAGSQLKPGTKGAQIVSLPPEHLAGAKKLVEMSLLKPYGTSKNKFTISKQDAYAVWEPTMAQIQRDLADSILGTNYRDDL